MKMFIQVSAVRPLYTPTDRISYKHSTMRSYIVACLIAGAIAFRPSATKGTRSPCQLPFTAAITRPLASCRSGVKLFAEDSQQLVESASASDSAAFVSTEAVTPQPATTTPTATPSKSEVLDKKYPLDIPSPLLLGSSMVLAISGTGAFVLLGRETTSSHLAGVESLDA